MKKPKLNIQKRTIALLADSQLSMIEAGANLKTAWRDCTYINCPEPTRMDMKK